MPTTNWRARAACIPVPDLFIADREEGRAEASRRNREARRICEHCPVRRVCLSDALSVEKGNTASQRAVVRGGMSPSRRAALSKPERARLILDGSPVRRPAGPA
ncbi:WhiB family transcriptional regulator [Streptomyces sp. NPDC087851]|uniref:WhiB family transcriptional regulator n=1 Tax=Streptomyces sp. NPDC087851 TaxID=3365810 RepID=UPI003814FC13